MGESQHESWCGAKGLGERIHKAPRDCCDPGHAQDSGLRRVLAHGGAGPCRGPGGGGARRAVPDKRTVGFRAPPWDVAMGCGPPGSVLRPASVLPPAPRSRAASARFAGFREDRLLPRGPRGPRNHRTGSAPVSPQPPGPVPHPAPAGAGSCTGRPCTRRVCCSGSRRTSAPAASTGPAPPSAAAAPPLPGGGGHRGGRIAVGVSSSAGRGRSRACPPGGTGPGPSTARYGPRGSAGC